MMKNENVKVVKSEKVWKPNENQRAFLEALKGYEEYIKNNFKL